MHKEFVIQPKLNNRKETSTSMKYFSLNTLKIGLLQCTENATQGVSNARNGGKDRALETGEESSLLRSRSIC